jgi:hypothetical protein
MDLSTAWRNHLLADSGVAAKVVARVYPMVLPQGCDYPAITYQFISNPQHHAIPVGFPRIQTTCWAESHQAARELAAAVTDACQRFKGLMGGAGGITVINVKFEDDRDLTEQPAPVDGRRLYQVPVDFKVIHRLREGA